MHDSSSPCCFVHHPNFISELEHFVHKHGSRDAAIDEVISPIEKLLFTHLYEKKLMFTSNSLGLAQGFSGFTVYWLKMVIPNCNLSKTQFPKAYFYKTDGHISFLCLASHIQNYKDSKLRATGMQRLQEIIEVLKTH